MRDLSALSLIAMLIPVLSYGEESRHYHGKIVNAGVYGLSPELRELLSREMHQLQDGMTEILPLYVSGNWSEIATIARKMQNSYVLKQNLSKEQMHELHAKLPDEFVRLDQQFHYLSGMLAHAAETKKSELVGFYFSKMSESCVNCHRQFATHRFPELAPEPKEHRH